MSFLPTPNKITWDFQAVDCFSYETLNLETDQETEVTLKVVLREVLIRTSIMAGRTIIVVEETPVSDTTSVFPLEHHCLLLPEAAELSVSLLVSEMIPPQIKDDVIRNLARHAHKAAIVAWEKETKKMEIFAVIEVRKEFLFSGVGLANTWGSRKATIHAC